MESFIEVKEKDVSLRFEVEKENMADFIRGYTPLLYHELAAAGYRLVESKAGVFKKDAVFAENAMAALAEYEKRAAFDFLV
jgi:hypothetical protein